jgi:hypothetical protein
LDDGEWRQGELVVENVAGVAATSWITSDSDSDGGGTHIHIRVYVRGRDNKISEHYYDDGTDGWRKGDFSAEGVTDLSAASYTKGNDEPQVSLRIYTVNAGRALMEHCYDGDGWYTGDLSLGDVDSVSATAWTRWGSGVFSVESTHLRVYTKEGPSNRLVERYWDGEWEDGDFTPA